MGFIEERKREIIMCSFIGVFIMSFLVSADTKLPVIEQHNYWVGGLAIIGAAVFFMNYWNKPAGRQYAGAPPGDINEGSHMPPIPPPSLPPQAVRPQKTYPLDNADPITSHVLPASMTAAKKKKEKKTQDA